MRELIIRNADKDLINAIVEICFNYLRGNINCSKKQFRELSKHRGCMRKIVKSQLNGKKCGGKKKNQRKREKEILLQKGGGFWFELLTPLVSELTTGLISKSLKR